MSLPKLVLRIFRDNPYHIYTARDLENIFSAKYDLGLSKSKITMILYRFYQKKLINRTPTQLADGYYYSLKNKALLHKIHQTHLFPYTIKDKHLYLDQITLSNFAELSCDNKLDLKKINHFNFLKNYEHNLDSPAMISMLTTIIGFIMCDGSINEFKNSVKLFFRRKYDACLFMEKFLGIFKFEDIVCRLNNKGGSYDIILRKASSAADFFYFLGAPKGNKVFQPFIVPDWIYQGPDEIKRIFLSTVIGNEGSAPSNNRWRIQFVLSKCEEHLSNLLSFLNQIRAMLYHFGITTSHIQLRKQKGRQFYGRFYIKGKENLHKFYNGFSFLYASEKQEVLNDLIFRDKISGRVMRNDRSEHPMIPLGDD